MLSKEVEYNDIPAFWLNSHTWRPSVFFESKTSLDSEHPDMTIGEFVATVFVPEHVMTKKLSGRIHYQQMLKHLLPPEQVDRMFPKDENKRSKRPNAATLKFIPNWPYLAEVRLRDAEASHIERLIAAVLDHGYSSQTATHIRNVVSAIYSCAMEKGFLTRGNPVSALASTRVMRDDTRVLTLKQTTDLLDAMVYPEKEMTLLTLFTGMNMAEICGLQWQFVNLTQAWGAAVGELVPPRSILVSKCLYLGSLESTRRNGTRRSVPISAPLLEVLLSLQRCGRFVGPDDFVLTCDDGTPINERQIARKQLKQIGAELQMPWLTWQVFHRTRKSLHREFGIHFDRWLMRQSIDATREQFDLAS